MEPTDHYLNKALHNIKFAANISTSSKGYNDWQIIALFYSAIHLLNYHIYQCGGREFRTHKEREAFLRPGSSVIRKASLDEDIWIAYRSLKTSSEICRYSFSDDADLYPNGAKSKTVFKALKSLNTILAFVNIAYGVQFSVHEILCGKLEKESLTYFRYPLG